MFDIQTKVTFTDDHVDVYAIRPCDAVALEEKYDISFLKAFADESEPRISWLYFLAHSASDDPREFTDWVRSVSTLDIIHDGVALFAAAAEVADTSV